MPLRYAILQHQPSTGEPHFDLLFETAPGSSLATWRSPTWPIEDPTEVIRLKDHRRIFLDYEGEISGNRGYVTRVAGGDCEVIVGENDRWTIQLLTGATLQTLQLSPINGDRWALETGPAQ